MKKIVIFCILTVCLLTACSNIPEKTETKTINEYEVLSVHSYISQKTNNFGGVVEEVQKYSFTYIDEQGVLHQIDNFQHMQYGLTKVCVGDENKYVIVEEGFDEYKYLYLTKNTLINMPSK